MSALNAVASSPSTYVLAGRFGDIWTSTDGASWTRRVTPPGVTATLHGAVFGSSQFVLVGEQRCCSPADSNATVLTSADGVTWTLRSTAPAGNGKTLNAVTFGTSLYVAVGRQGTILTSPDAVTWTAQSSNTTDDLKGVSFGSGAFVAVGNSRKVLRSTDGTNWSAATVPATTGTSYEDVTHTGSQFVTVGDQGAVLTSPDGSTWTDRSMQSPFQLTSLSSVANGSGVIVAGDAYQVFSSPDGITWTKRTLRWSDGEPNPFITALTFGPAGFVATGQVRGTDEGGTLQTSPDGITWTKRTLAASRHLAAAAYTDGTFCAVGFGGAVASSADGITWTNRVGLPVPADTHNNYYWRDMLVSSVGGRFVAVGSSSVGAPVMTSTDCITWTAGSWGHGGGLAAIAEGAGLLVAVGARSSTPLGPQDLPVIATSSNGGDSWTLRSPTADGILEGVGFRPESSPGAGNALFVTLGVDVPSGTYLLYTSPDGITWTQQTPTGLPSSPNVIGHLIYANGTFVLGSGAGAWTSPDGVAWTKRGGGGVTEFSMSPSRVIYADGRFVGLGFNGGVWTSSDAITWIPIDSATGHSLGGVAYSSSLDRFVAVGDSVIMYAAGDAPPTISINDVIVTEGNSGSSNATFTLSLSAASTHAVTVGFATANGTATAGSDYAAISGTLTFSPGSLTQTLLVAVAGDSTPEPDETYSVVLSGPANAAIAKAIGAGTIADDDSGVVLPRISIDDRAVSEGSAVNAGFRLTLSAPSSQTVTVNYTTANGTATAPSDYAATAGSLSFSPGRTSHSIFIPIVTDTTPEGIESFFVNLSSPTNATFARSQATGSIGDPPAAVHAAMYRAYNVKTDYHFFTTDLSSKNFAVGVLGFQDESAPVPFYVWNAGQTGAVPLFRMYNPNLGRHFYTAGVASRDFLMGIGAVYEKEEGFVYPLGTSPLPSGATELFLLYNNNSGTHLFTADASQKNGILSLFPGVWVQHTSVGYVFTNP